MSDVAFPGTIANTGGAFGEEAQTPPLMDPVTLAYSGGGGSPAGSNGAIQYNDDGAFGGIINVVWDDGHTQLDIQSGVVLEMASDAIEGLSTHDSYIINDRYSGNLLIGGPNNMGDGVQIVPDASVNPNDSGLIIYTGDTDAQTQVYTVQNADTSTMLDDGNGNISQQTEGSYIQVGAASRIYSGSGAPTISANAGDFYFRSDTPGVSMQNIYTCTGTTNWTALV